MCLCYIYIQYLYLNIHRNSVWTVKNQPKIIKKWRKIAFTEVSLCLNESYYLSTAVNVHVGELFSLPHGWLALWFSRKRFWLSAQSWNNLIMGRDATSINIWSFQFLKIFLFRYNTIYIILCPKCIHLHIFL